jgi:DMSO/TMAO reductase YedYZ heme-binding membrane subunit
MDSSPCPGAESKPSRQKVVPITDPELRATVTTLRIVLLVIFGVPAAILAATDIAGVPRALGLLAATGGFLLAGTALFFVFAWAAKRGHHADIDAELRGMTADAE